MSVSTVMLYFVMLAVVASTEREETKPLGSSRVKVIREQILMFSKTVFLSHYNCKGIQLVYYLLCTSPKNSSVIINNSCFTIIFLKGK